jgi:transposase
MSQRKRYTKQFKEEALRLVSQEGVSLSQVANDLGLDASMLRRWRKEAGMQGPTAFRGVLSQIAKWWETLWVFRPAQD